jgi:hypothetical protein
VRTALALALPAVLLVAGPAAAQVPIEDELVLQAWDDLEKKP